MSGFFSHANGSSKLNLLVISVAVLALFCIAAPSAKAQTSMTVNATGPASGWENCDGSFTATYSINASGGVNFVETAASLGENLGPCFAGTGAGQNTVALDTGQFSTFDTGASSGTLAQFLSFQDGTYVEEDGNICGNGNVSNCTSAFGNVAGDTFDVVITGSGASTVTTLEHSTTNTVPPISFDTPVTPEPSSMLLFGSGLLVLGGIFRKKLGLSRTAI